MAVIYISLLILITLATLEANLLNVELASPGHGLAPADQSRLRPTRSVSDSNIAPHSNHSKPSNQIHSTDVKDTKKTQSTELATVQESTRAPLTGQPVAMRQTRATTRRHGQLDRDTAEHDEDQDRGEEEDDEELMREREREKAKRRRRKNKHRHLSASQNITTTSGQTTRQQSMESSEPSTSSTKAYQPINSKYPYEDYPTEEQASESKGKKGRSQQNETTTQHPAQSAPDQAQIGQSSLKNDSVMSNSTMHPSTNHQVGNHTSDGTSASIHERRKDPSLLGDQRDQSSTNMNVTDPLDPRSPNGKLTKRITSLLNDAKSKLPQRGPITTTPSPMRAANTPETVASSKGGDNVKSAPDKPNENVSTTNIPHTLAKSDSIQDENIDWSKLVRITFKSAKNNQSITVVTNSSELSNNPIRDWSSEMPKLLNRDFDRLIEKWSSVFPVDWLMSDLGQIIVQKVTGATGPSPTKEDNSLIAANVSSVVKKLNETLGFDTTMKPTTLSSLPRSNTSTTIHPINSTTDLVTGGNGSDTTAKPADWSMKIPRMNSTSDKGSQTSAHVLAPNMTQEANARRSKPDANPIGPHPSHPSDNIGTSTSAPGHDLHVGNRTAGNGGGPKNMSHHHEHRVRVAGNSSTSDDLVREHAKSLRHFMVICSVAVVLATSIAVAIIVVLLR